MATLDTYDAIFDSAISFLEQQGARLGKLTAPLVVAVKESRNTIESEYETLRDTAKKRYMQSETEPLDRHKCVACFMVAVITSLDITEILKNPTVPRLIKETVAIEIGLSILITMIRENPAKNATVINFLDNNENEIVFPVPLCDDDEYLLNWARGLFYDHEDNRLSVLSLSNTLFLIESFNWERAKSESAGKVFRLGD
ncbi:hypothetical protein R80B4_01748 [Fibrobacteres bacterium R8-0-B4]